MEISVRDRVCGSYYEAKIAEGNTTIESGLMDAEEAKALGGNLADAAWILDGLDEYINADPESVIYDIVCDKHGRSLDFSSKLNDDGRLVLVVEQCKECLPKETLDEH